MSKPVSRVVETELGQEARCSQCSEFWPADSEFFFITKGKPHAWCKACYVNHPTTLAKVARWKEGQQAKRAASKGAVGSTSHQAPAGAIVNTSRSD